MRNVLFLISLFITFTVSAQEEKKVVIKAGTTIPMQSINSVKAAEVEVGEIVDFKVMRDIEIDGVRVIRHGTLVKGKVTEAKKSSLAGTKGRLTININSLVLPSGDTLFFTDTYVRIRGENRTPLAIITAIVLWPCIFIPGTKAVMPAGYEVLATVASNTTVVAD